LNPATFYSIERNVIFATSFELFARVGGAGALCERADPTGNPDLPRAPCTHFCGMALSLVERSPSNIVCFLVTKFGKK